MSLKLSLLPKSIPLTLETSDGEVELLVSKFTIMDADRRHTLTTEVFDDPNSTELDKYNAVQIARIMCSVKHTDGGYFWDQGIKHFKMQNYEMDFINALVEAVNEVNPLPQLSEDTKTAFDAKKKQS